MSDAAGLESTWEKVRGADPAGKESINKQVFD